MQGNRGTVIKLQVWDRTFLWRPWTVLHRIRVEFDMDRQWEHIFHGAEDRIVSNILIDPVRTADIAGCPKKCPNSADGI